MRHHAIALFGVLFLLCTCAFGQAAKQHFLAGQSYYQQGRYQKAVDEFQEAYRIDPRPLLLYNISQAYERLGDLQQAVDYLGKFVEAAPENDDIKTHRYKLRNLQERIANTGIQVTANETGATIYVDGVEVGLTPVAEIIPVDVGPHVVKITKAGYADFVMNVAISWGYSVPINAQLPSESAAPVGTDDAPREETTAMQAETDSSSNGFVRALPWIIAGTGAATAVIGWAGLGTVANNDGNTDLALVADILGFTGVAMAVGGTVWGIVAAQKRKNAPTGVYADARRWMVTPMITDETVAFSATLRF